MSRIEIIELKSLVQKLTPRAGLTELSQDTDLFAAGVLDSLSIIQLITQLEKNFAFTFDFNDLKFENFRSLNDLQRLLQDVYKL